MIVNMVVRYFRKILELWKLVLVWVVSLYVVVWMLGLCGLIILLMVLLGDIIDWMLFFF